MKGITLEGDAGVNMFSSRNMTLSTSAANRTNVSGEILITNPEKLPLSPLTATYSKDEDVWTISSEELDAPLKGRSKFLDLDLVYELMAKQSWRYFTFNNSFRSGIWHAISD